jgi:tRNA modification GTPase
MSGRSIFALSVSPGRSALHVTRISGECAFLKATALFQKESKILNFLLMPHPARGLFYERIFDQNGELIDDTVVSVFKGPHSYTGENTLEISSHGNPLITAKLHGALRASGFVDAEPGEFTQQAYLNGKKDLAQAEAIHQLITAQTENGLQLARSVADGKLTEEIQELKNGLLGALAYLEAHIDFEESDVGTFDGFGLLPKLQEVQTHLRKLSKSYDSGQKIRSGLATVLCGLPNAGKSTLFNTLLNTERAIVTPIPGTTRDYLEERLSIEGRDLVLVDTAGIRDSQDLVEQMGVSRSLQRVKDADILIYAIDGTGRKELLSQELADFGVYLAKSTARHLVFAVTKADIVDIAVFKTWISLLINLKSAYLVNDCKVDIHFAQVGPQKTDELINMLKGFYDDWGLKDMIAKEPMLIAQRQKDCVDAALKALIQTQDLIQTKDFPEKMASCLLGASYELSSILGEITPDEILGQVFSTFCIGK